MREFLMDQKLRFFLLAFLKINYDILFGFSLRLIINGAFILDLLVIFNDMLHLENVRSMTGIPIQSFS